MVRYRPPSSVSEPLAGPSRRPDVKRKRPDDEMEAPPFSFSRKKQDKGKGKDSIRREPEVPLFSEPRLMGVDVQYGELYTDQIIDDETIARQLQEDFESGPWRQELRNMAHAHESEINALKTQAIGAREQFLKDLDKEKHRAQESVDKADQLVEQLKKKEGEVKRMEDEYNKKLKKETRKMEARAKQNLDQEKEVTESVRTQMAELKHEMQEREAELKRQMQTEIDRLEQKHIIDLQHLRGNVEVFKNRFQLTRTDMATLQVTYREDIGRLQAHLSCAICFDRLTRPHVLPNCGHVFCFGCIDGWIQQITSERNRELPPEHRKPYNCPSCRTVFTEQTAPIEMRIFRDLVQEVADAVEHIGSVSLPNDPMEVAEPVDGTSGTLTSSMVIDLSLPTTATARMELGQRPSSVTGEEEFSRSLVTMGDEAGPNQSSALTNHSAPPVAQINSDSKSCAPSADMVDVIPSLDVSRTRLSRSFVEGRARVAAVVEASNLQAESVSLTTSTSRLTQSSAPMAGPSRLIPTTHIRHHPAQLNSGLAALTVCPTERERLMQMTASSRNVTTDRSISATISRSPGTSAASSYASTSASTNNRRIRPLVKSARAQNIPSRPRSSSNRTFVNRDQTGLERLLSAPVQRRTCGVPRMYPREVSFAAAGAAMLHSATSSLSRTAAATRSVAASTPTVASTSAARLTSTSTSHDSICMEEDNTCIPGSYPFSPPSRHC